MRASPRARHVVGPAVGESVGVSSMAAEYPIQATLERTLLSAASVFLTEPDHKSTPVSVEVIDFIERLAVESGSHQRVIELCVHRRWTMRRAQLVASRDSRVAAAVDIRIKGGTAAESDAQLSAAAVDEAAISQLDAQKPKAMTMASIWGGAV